MLVSKKNLNYRNNVGIVIKNKDGKVLMCKRTERSVGEVEKWQFPQGGVDKNEDLTLAMYRELKEETGITKAQVKRIASTKNWLYYETPKPIIREKILYHGQRQKWFLLELIKDTDIAEFITKKSEEFDDYKWINFAEVIAIVVDFKKTIYQQIQAEFASHF